jgi:hypothetical protein
MTIKMDLAESVMSPIAAAAPPVGLPAQATMGALESLAYRTVWREPLISRRRAKRSAGRKRDIVAGDEIRRSASDANGGFAGVRKKWAEYDYEPDEDLETIVVRKQQRASRPVTAADVAARLILARQFDRRPGLLEAIRTFAPVSVRAMRPLLARVGGGSLT